MSQVQPSPSTTPKRSFWRFVPPILAALLVAVLAYALLKPQGGDPGGPLVGKAAPNFNLKMLDGGTLSLASLKGRPVVVNFWASWCPPCRDEAPLLAQLSGQQSAGGLAVVGVLFQDKPADSRKFVNEEGLAYPNLLDPNSDIAINYGVSAVPETFFIDKDGVVRAHVRQGLTAESLKENLAKIGVGN